MPIATSLRINGLGKPGVSADVREATWRFLNDYNEHRPHNALGGMTPAEFRNHHETGSSTFKLSA